MSQSNVARKTRRILRIALLSLGCLIALAGLALIGVLQLWPSDHYTFLAGRKPTWAGMIPPMETDDFVHPGVSVPPREYRIYIWKENFDAVRARATKELEDSGFKPFPHPDSKDYCGWSRKDGNAIGLRAGHSDLRGVAMRETFPADHAWITVICTNEAPETWITHVRIAFERHY